MRNIAQPDLLVPAQHDAEDRGGEFDRLQSFAIDRAIGEELVAVEEAPVGAVGRHEMAKPPDKGCLQLRFSAGLEMDRHGRTIPQLKARTNPHASVSGSSAI